MTTEQIIDRVLTNHLVSQAHFTHRGLNVSEYVVEQPDKRLRLLWVKDNKLTVPADPKTGEAYPLFSAEFGGVPRNPDGTVADPLSSSQEAQAARAQVRAAFEKHYAAQLASADARPQWTGGEAYNTGGL